MNLRELERVTESGPLITEASSDVEVWVEDEGDMQYAVTGMRIHRDYDPETEDWGPARLVLTFAGEA